MAKIVPDFISPLVKHFDEILLHEIIVINVVLFSGNLIIHGRVKPFYPIKKFFASYDQQVFFFLRSCLKKIEHNP